MNSLNLCLVLTALLSVTLHLANGCSDNSDCARDECCAPNLVRSKSCKKVKGLGETCGGRECLCSRGLSCQSHETSFWNRFRESGGRCVEGSFTDRQATDQQVDNLGQELDQQWNDDAGQQTQQDPEGWNQQWNQQTGVDNGQQNQPMIQQQDSDELDLLQQGQQSDDFVQQGQNIEDFQFPQQQQSQELDLLQQQGQQEAIQYPQQNQESDELNLLQQGQQGQTQQEFQVPQQKDSDELELLQQGQQQNSIIPSQQNQQESESDEFQQNVQTLPQIDDHKYVKRPRIH